MTESQFASIAVHFADLKDPRVVRDGTHPLINILTIGLCAVIAGGQYFTDMETFGKEKRSWLEKFLDLKDGIPAHDTFNRVFAALKPAEFEKCLLSWISALHETTGGQLLHIDGKTLRGSYDKASSKAAIHMVSVWASAQQLSLASQVVDEKSNEITAIPPLLKMLEISGALVTIDAMGCQKEIARTICEERADYVLQVKGNQPKLLEATESFFQEHLENNFADYPCRRVETKEKGHGRSEERYYYVAKMPQDFPLARQWKGLKALGMSIRYCEYDDGRFSEDVSYYILSLYPSGRRFAEAVRGHWSIENQLHWQLDVTFGEDALRVRKDHAPANLSILMRTALSLLKNNQTKRGSVRSKRYSAALNEQYIEEVLTLQ